RPSRPGCRACCMVPVPPRGPSGSCRHAGRRSRGLQRHRARQENALMSDAGSAEIKADVVFDPASPDIDGVAVNDCDVDAAASFEVVRDESTDVEPESKKVATAHSGNGATMAKATDLHANDSAPDARTAGNDENLHGTEGTGPDEAASQPPGDTVEPKVAAL